MQEEFTKKTIKELMKLKGEVRGLILRQDLEYVQGQKGREGLEKIEDQLALWGYPVKYEKIKNIEFYPSGLRALSLLAMRKVFGWDDKKIGLACAYHIKDSLAMRFFMKYLSSPSHILEKAPIMWREYWTVGEMKVIKFNGKEKYAIVRLENFDLHPIFCRCLEGYLKSITNIVIRDSKTTCQETQCSFKNGKNYHEFLIKWK